MISKLKRLDELSDISSRIIVNGMRLSCLLMFTGLALHLVNTYSGNYSLYMVALSKYIIESAVSTAAIVLIGGLMFDYYFKSTNPRNRETHL